MRKETGDFSENKSFYSYVGDHLMPSASAKSAIPSGNARQTRFYDSFVYFLAMFDILAIISFKNFPSSSASAAGGEDVDGGDYGPVLLCLPLTTLFLRCYDFTS
jgi:hypothetical protein